MGTTSPSPRPDLVEVLSRLDIGDAIPPELYAVVAEILTFVYRLNAKRGTCTAADPPHPAEIR